MSNEDDSPCMAHLGDSVSGFTTKLFYLSWGGRHHTAPFLLIIISALFWVTQGQETIFFAPSQVFGCYWHSPIGGLRTRKEGTRWPGSAIAPGIGSALTLTSCAISLLSAAPQACQRVGGREGEGGKFWGRGVLALLLRRQLHLEG